jgi:GNAT superfamily N-acetyltransferase
MPAEHNLLCSPVWGSSGAARYRHHEQVETPSSDRPAARAEDHLGNVDISVVADQSQVEQLLPLMRAYCDFYHSAPPDESLLALTRALIADPGHEGVQFLATQGGVGIGFATLFWSWETTVATRVGVMNDLYVAPASRGRGVSSALIDACVQRCRAHGASRMIWQTALDNLRAQAVYDHIGATRERWLDYWLET